MKKATTPTTKEGSANGQVENSPSVLIDARIKELDDWRGNMLARLRALIRQAGPEVLEEWKWQATGTPKNSRSRQSST
jgi:hypothetical protein